MSFTVTAALGGPQGEAGQTFQTGVETFQAIEASTQGQLNARSYRQEKEKAKKAFISSSLRVVAQQFETIQSQWVNQVLNVR